MRRAERRAALALFQASAADYQQTVLRAFQQVADTLTALSHDADLLRAQQRAVDVASRAVTLERANYETGAVGILNLLDAQRQYRQAVLGQVKAEGQQYLDTVSLFVVTGGADNLTHGDLPRTSRSCVTPTAAPLDGASTLTPGN